MTPDPFGFVSYGASVLIDPIVASAIETAKAEKSYRAVRHLLVSGYKPTDEESAAIDALPLNGGSAPKPETAIMHDHLARFLNAFIGAKGKARGKQHTKRALRHVLPDFQLCPDGTTLCSDEKDEDGLAWRIIKGKRAEITALAKILRNANKDLDRAVSGRNDD